MGFEDHYIVHGVPKPLEPGLTCALFRLKSRKHRTQDYSTTAPYLCDISSSCYSFCAKGEVAWK